MTTSALGAGRSSADRPAPATDRAALRRCIAVDPDDFAREHWGARPLLSRAADLPGPFTDLLDLDAVDELLSRRGLRTPFLRIAKNGAVVDSSSFTGGGGVGAEIGDQVHDDRVLDLFAGGSTVVLQALHRTWPAVVDLATALCADLGHPVQANAYITPPSSRGFSAHYDVHDVFVLQLAGTKHWTVHAPVHPDPLRDQPWTDHATAVARRAADDEPVVDAVLEPGDALYLPRGYLHSAVAQGVVSAHLTVGVHVVTRYALVEALLALLADRPELRRTLPLGVDVADPEQLAPHLAAVTDVLRDAVTAVPAERVARRVRRRVWGGNRPEPVRPVAGASFAADLREGDRVRRRLGLRSRLVPRRGDLLLELPDRTVTLPAATRQAVEALLTGAEAVLGELPGLDAADQVVLVRRLLREGVLVPAAP